MRPAMQFVDCASGFNADITVSKGSQTVDAKSIMQITMLAAAKGTKLTITAVGNSAQKAVDALAEVLENNVS